MDGSEEDGGGSSGGGGGGGACGGEGWGIHNKKMREMEREEKEVQGCWWGVEGDTERETNWKNKRGTGALLLFQLR